MTKISLLIPTRGRPKILNRLLESIVRNTNNLADIEIILYIDEDDKSHEEIRSQSFTLTIKKLIRSKATMGACNTACFKESTGDIIILLNDDVVMRTANWDRILTNETSKIDDQIYLIYPNDLFKQKKLPTFPILSRRTCELLQDPFPAAYKGSFIETQLFDIFIRLKYQGFDRIKYLDNVIFEHMHHRLDKAALDQTYKNRNRFGDDFTFVAFTNQRQTQTKQLIRAINKQPITDDTFKNIIISAAPKDCFSALSLFYKNFMADKSLPIMYRSYLFYYHCVRYLAAKIIKTQADTA